MKPAVPPKPKIVQNENIDTSTGFSVSAAKALFEAAKKPEVRNAAMAAAKNPFVRQTAKNVAQDEKARGAVLNAVKDPSASNKFSAAFAVHEANRNQKSTASSSSYAPPPPPPHRGASSSSSDYSSISRAAPPKLSSSHAAIRSQLENLHLGGKSSTSVPATSPKPSESAASYSYQNSTTSSSSSYTPASFSATPLPPLPSHSSHTPSSFSSGFNSTPNGPHAIAQYSYSAVQSDEVSLNIGDVFILKKHVDDQWIYGENPSNGQSGIVPLSYLQIIIDLPKAQPPRPAPPSTSNNSSQIYATALYDYNSMQPGDLVFSQNQSIVVTNKINDDWLEGEANGKHGIFPSNFVSCSRLYEVPMKSSTATSAPGQHETVTVAFDYFSGVDGDLQCKEGDLISIIENIDSQWIMGELHGRRGLVPKSFLGPPFGSTKKVSKGIAEISNAFSPKKGIAIGDYHSEDPKHLYVTRGDHLLIVEDVDEYYYRGKLEAFKTLPAGILPKNVVELSH